MMPSKILVSRTRPGGWLAAAVAAAAVLAACAVTVRQLKNRAERDFPPKGQFLDVDGVRLHYQTHGREDAPQTVVLLHGNGVMAEELELSGLVERAAREHRVIVFDRPGFGYSERPADRSWTPEAQADLLDAALRQLGVHHPVVLGHSWGANVAMAMGLRHPQRVGALVLASGYYTPSLRFDVTLLSMPALPIVGTLLRHTLSPLLGRLLWPLSVRRMFSPAETTAAFRERYPVWMSLRPSQLRASGAETARMIPSAISLRRRHHELQVPTVIVAGADDRLLSTRWNSVKLNDRLPHATLRIVEGAGHMVHHTAPDEVMRAIDVAAGLARATLPPAETPAEIGPTVPAPKPVVDIAGARHAQA
jgi:pimeloyl-ACP methyl ester carboxylesterase